MNKNIIFLLIYTVFIVISFLFGFVPGKQIGNNFFFFIGTMIKILPCAFILIGLFEVWIKKESIEKHLGQDSGVMAYIWVILLAGTIVGGFYFALPVAYALFNKGARLSVIFTYIGAAAIARIPMTLFEVSFLGIKFTIIRFVVSIPLLILSSLLLEKYLMKRNYKIMPGK